MSSRTGASAVEVVRKRTDCGVSDLPVRLMIASVALSSYSVLRRSGASTDSVTTPPRSPPTLTGTRAPPNFQSCTASSPSDDGSNFSLT